MPTAPDIPLPALPAEPPDLPNPPDPAVDAHAFNRWLAVVANYKWLVSKHEARGRTAAIEAATAAMAEAAADYFDALEKGREVKAADLFMDLLQRMQVRPGDTDANIPGQIDKTVRPLLEQLQKYRTEGV